MTGSNTSEFDGFGFGRERPTPIPSSFFQELLPEIEELHELQVTLYAFWALSGQGDETPYLKRSELLQDGTLRAMLAGSGEGEDGLNEGLELAVQRGSLLQSVAEDGEGEVLYFLNDERGRAAQSALNEGEWKPASGIRSLRIGAGRRNVYALYEQNIGALTPMLAERLREAEREYPTPWIEEAIGIAVENNARKWRYIEAILEDWKTKGRDDREDRRDAEEARQRYLGGEFGEFIEG